MIILRHIPFFIFWCFVLGSSFYTSAFAAEYPITVRGVSSVEVTRAKVQMSDISHIDFDSSADSDQVMNITNIVVGNSPAPGESKEISAHSVVEKIRISGIPVKTVGYAFPQKIMIRRASRRLAEDEVREVVEKYLQEQKPHASIRRIRFLGNHEVFTGRISFSVQETISDRMGRIQIPLTVTSEDGETLNVGVIAQISEMRSIPVARHPLKRGDQIGKGDVVRARIDVSKAPEDVVNSFIDLIGMQVERGVNAGDFFRYGAVGKPPLVNRGKPVVMKYRTGALTASASGVALDDGVKGDEVRVRNDDSMRIIRARVTGKGQVEVGL